MKFTDKISADEIKKEIDAEFSKSSDKTDYDKVKEGIIKKAMDNFTVNLAQIPSIFNPNSQ